MSVNVYCGFHESLKLENDVIKLENIFQALNFLNDDRTKNICN